jgi:hypothetical protein
MKNRTFPRIGILAVVILLLALALIPILNRTKHTSTPAKPSTAEQNPPKAPLLTKPHRHGDREADRQLAEEGARTDITLSTFPIKAYQPLRSPAGKAAGAPEGDAYIHIPSAGRRISMEANQIGEFPTVETQLNDTVGVRLQLDSVKPGTPVRVVIMDGGSFPAATGMTQILEAAKWGGAAFEFTTSANIGFHRVLVQAQGQPSRILNFSAHDPETWPASSTVSAQ